MRLLRSFALASTLILISLASPARPRAAADEVLPFKATEHTLANGLRVIVVPTGPAFGVRLVIVDATGLGATTRESAARVDLPPMSSLTFMFLLPGPTVIEYPAVTLKRSVMPITIGDVVLHETVNACSVVESAVVPVAWHNDVVTGKLRPSDACGNTIPAGALFFIQIVKVTVEPLVITPPRFGTPVCVSKEAIVLDPGV